MAVRGPRPALLLPLLLLAAGLALSSGQRCVELNRIFQNEHVDYPRISLPPTPYCNRVMDIRQIYGKPLNTFIHAPNPNINNVCFAGGIPRPDGLRQSRAIFYTTTCRYNPFTRSYTGTAVSRRILIRCCGGLPVYYQE